MSLQVYELTESRDWNRHNSYGAVIVDTVTDVPLPLQVFPSADCAEHFLIWAEREGCEPFGSDKFYNVIWAEREGCEPFGSNKFYNALELLGSFNDWWAESMSEDGESLTDKAQEEVDTHGD